ncbi:pentapeptide repeat-containing protein [Calothrix sp. UHCC 0171]|uniref:pentapeptide repeat-containing protein n=1 Tax=Calothrix sp. UHCC 0171 TaxID=3110245 RepID=UPI002B1EB332|nr:pentapeptide repeat-containing protein [Calothrix sp. UHCC 0171]MEA5572975.1 pentapeptide repeat-containing protein [Calothrix sp. UHCC 0171]
MTTNSSKNSPNEINQQLNNDQNNGNQISNQPQSQQDEKEKPDFLENVPGEKFIKSVLNPFLGFLQKIGVNVNSTLVTFVIGLSWLVTMEIPNHHQTSRSGAWDIINSASDQSGDGGRTSSLEDLNNWQKQRQKWNIPFVSDLIFGSEIKLEALKASNANLSGIKLDRAILNYANFQESQFWNANFENSILKNVNFQRAILAGANLKYAQLQGANLSGANLSCFHKDNQQQDKQDIKTQCTELINADLTGAKLIGANLIGVDLTGANLKNADLTGTVYNQRTLDTLKIGTPNFQQELENKGYMIKPGIKLISKDLTDVNLSGADLSNAELIGVNLSGADLREVNLQNANLSRSVYTETTKFPDGYSPKNAYLIKHGIKLINKDLSGVNLNNASLVGVNLTKANLANAILTDADLTKAQLKEANLENTNLENAKVSEEQLKAAKSLCNAKMPDGEVSDFGCKP